MNIQRNEAHVPSPITTEIVRGALRSIQGEMEVLIERTAMSAFIREKKDFHAALFDRYGRLIVAKSRPTSTSIVTPILNKYPADEIEPGDLFWYNDCYATGGAVSHTPDIVFIAPIFHADTLVAFVQSAGHFTDIGGMRPGSISPSCTEIFQEGVIIPPCKLASRGKINEDMLQLFVRNSRYPDALEGDVNALIAALRLGERRYQDLIARFGSVAIMKSCDELIERTRKEVTRRFRELVPEGTYAFTDAMDSDGHGHGPIKLRWELKVSQDEISIDGSASDDQVLGPVNYLMSKEEPSLVFSSYLLGNSKEFFLNDGAAGIFDDVRVRPGSILQPNFPAALGQRSITKYRNLSAYLGLLAVATGGNAQASHSAYVIWFVRGKDLNGDPFLMSDGVAVGWGGRPQADGHDAIYLIAQENYPVEFVEGNYPLRVREYGINTDSGGAGLWRGGCGVVREIQILSEEASLAVRFDSVVNPPWGVGGGHSGKAGRCVVNPGTDKERVLAPLSDNNIVRKGDIVRLETGGGGGWGHPYDRQPELVLADVLGGFVSRDRARSDYGVVLTDDGEGVDVPATTTERQNRPETKLFHRNTYQEVLD